ncbi:polymorphic toxin-type HINT domain-containing protein [Aquimarina longa]|uniref:polymorphic toxin-type HINT domain-containing protein n=1 Tax=Aquimarina longa TaxID=1080221 RepID=UPI00078264A3|nr:polymorphic toxin-type HINT domain-containing protein [Aquimarina longa]
MPHDLEYIVKDALMMCDKGALPAPFTPTSNTHIKINSCLVTTKSDKAPMTNIPSFGACAVKNGNPCTPAPIDWTDTYKVKVKGQETILFKSKMPCSTGGKIEFITSGQIPIPPEEYDKLMEEHGEDDDSGWGWWDTAELIPVVGNIIGMVREGAKGNWGMVALNAGFLVLDIVTLGTASIGTAAVKGAIKGGIKVAAKKTAQKALQGAVKLGTKQGLKQVGKGFAKAAAKRVDAIASLSKKVCVFACFTSGTKVAIKEGHKNIEDIRIGDLVWAYNEETGESDLKPVVTIMEKEIDATIQLTLGNEVIETTAEHPFYTQNGWKDAADLTTTDQVKTKNGNWQRIEATNFLYSKKKVYNFEVADWHTYFVGAWEWLVHNAKVCLHALAKTGVKYAKNILNGQMFDKAMRKAYGAANSQIKMANGKFLDVLKNNQIISHKFTQLSDVTFNTAKKYIDEIGSKYANQTTKSKKLIKQVETKKMNHILEIPPQKNGIPDEILKYAKKKGVKVREISGEALKQFNKMKFW